MYDPFDFSTFMSIELENLSTVYSYDIRVSTQLLSYSDEGVERTTIRPGETITIDVNPVFDFDALFGIRSDRPSTIRTIIEETDSGTIVMEDDLDITVTDPHIFFYTIYFTPTRSLWPVMATSSAPEIISLVSESADHTPWGDHHPGYADEDLPARVFEDIGVRGWALEPVYITTSESGLFSITFDRVTGGTGADIDFYFLDYENCIEFTDGRTSTALRHAPDVTSGRSFTLEVEDDGTYCLVYYNTGDNWVSRDVTRSRSASHYEVTEWTLRSIYELMDGFSYVSVTADHFEGSQRARYPADTLTDRAGNCADMSLVFVSALERLEMRPVLIEIPGHVFPGVRLWDDRDMILPVEAQHAGTQPFDEARDFARANFSEARETDTLEIIEILDARENNIVEAPYSR